MMKKYIQLLIALILGLFLGMYSYFTAIDSFEVYLLTKDFTFSKTDLLRKIFVTTDFHTAPYLDKENPLLIFLPFLYYLGGILLGMLGFLYKTKSYHQFIAIRLGTQKALLRNIKGSFFPVISVYTSGYLAVILLLTIYHATYPFDLDFWQLVGGTILFGIARITLVVGLVQLSFIFYLKLTPVMAQLFSFGALLVLFILDLNSSFFNLIFFDIPSYFLEGIIIGLSFILLSNIILTKITYELN